MIFSSLPYVFFLFAVVVLYWRLPVRFRIPLLLLASYVFYMSWSPPYGLIYAPVIFLDTLYFYWLSLAMVRWPQWKKKILVFGITSELLLLVYFKYSNFLMATLDSALLALNLPAPQVRFDIFLPLAISFTNFILISYLVDIYRGEEVPDRSFTRFATYVAFFPHLIAGPIVRAKELLRQFDFAPPFRHENLVKGMHRFAAGLFIKLFVADIMGFYVDPVYGNPELQAFNTSWVASYAFSIQLFCDFFGYTMMAQGSALMMGYTLPDNFNAPYFSKNMSEFWKRWHISLSRWLKDYLYIPLGGSRCSKLKTYRNLFVTMALGGLWHGANWTFMIWGVMQGLMLCLYKTGRYLNINRFIPTALAIFLTFHGVVLARVFFRAQSLEEALHLLSTMANPWVWHAMEAPHISREANTLFLSTSTTLVMIVLFMAIHGVIHTCKGRVQMPALREATVAVGYASLLYFLVTLGGTESQQFIYFQF